MNEIELSKDINQIELEINWHKENAGKSVWEIGRRLNHVKTQDLAHGQFSDWLEKIGINHNTANRFMRVAKEIPNSDTYHNLGTNALYLISTLPEEQKQEQLDKAEQGNPATTRELRELKKKLKQAQTEVELAKRSEQIAIEQLEREPEVIRETIEKEVVPDDYEDLKRKVKSTEEELKFHKDRNEFLESTLQRLYDEREEVDEKSRKYDELNEAIKNAEYKLNDNQKMISRYNKLIRMIEEVDNVIMKASGFVYTDISDITGANGGALRDIENLIYNLERLADDLKESIKGNQILEGEIVND